MGARVWLLAAANAYGGLEELLKDREITIVRVVSNLAEVTASLYDATGLLVIDAGHPEAVTALSEGSTLIPVVALAGKELSLPDGVMRIDPSDSDERMAHHLIEVLNQGGNVRRYPRVTVDLSASIEGAPYRVKDASMYGVWLEPCGGHETGQTFELAVALSDGAIIKLLGSVVGRRSGGLAVRVRPVADSDLLLWLHLLLGELADSPIHADADVFGPLFR